MKWLMEPVAVALGIIIVIVAVMLFGGFYLKTTQTPITPAPTPVTPQVTLPPTEIPTTIPATPTPPPVVTLPPPPTTPPGNYAVPAKAYEDRKYYKLPYKSTVYDPRLTSLPPVIYQQNYDGKFQSEGVVIHVVSTPLMIDYALTSLQSPTRSFFYLTIRNNETQELLAQDGFLGPYSEDRRKRLTFSTPGDYHINMYGGFVGVQLSLRAPR